MLLGASLGEALGVSENGIGAACAIVGTLLLLAGTYLHPMPADPNNAAQAFAACAGDRLWVVSHLMQLAGIVLALAALLIIARQLASEGSAVWAYLASAGAITSLTLAAALQAVDGIALKAMVENWVTAPPAQKEVAFQSALAVRQIEIGLASMLSLLLGVAAMLYGMALFDSVTYPKWVGWFAIAGGLPTSISGVVMAFGGFSDLEMTINMPATFVLLIWVLTLGLLMWRRSRIPLMAPLR